MAISSKDLESLWQRYKVESVDGVSDMERKQYLDQIHELVQTVQTLLDANIALSNKQKEQKAEYDRKIAGLQTHVDKLTGKLQDRRRKMHVKSNENQTGSKSVNKGDGVVLP